MIFEKIHLILVSGMKKLKMSAVLLGSLLAANPANSAVVAYNTIIDQMTPFLGNGVQTPSYKDYTAYDPNLIATFRKTTDGYSLVVAGQSGFGLFGPTAVADANHPAWTSSTNSLFLLIANFSSTGVFNPTGSELQIKGNLINTPSGTTAATDNVFYDANLTSFGYNASQADIGFTTQFKSSWINQTALTGGSLGESVYLVDGGLFSGQGALSPLIAAFQSGNFDGITGHYSFPLTSLAIIPLPAPLTLFISGLASLFCIGRRRTKTAVLAS